MSIPKQPLSLPPQITEHRSSKAKIVGYFAVMIIMFVLGIFFGLFEKVGDTGRKLISVEPKPKKIEDMLAQQSKINKFNNLVEFQAFIETHQSSSRGYGYHGGSRSEFLDASDSIGSLPMPMSPGASTNESGSSFSEAKGLYGNARGDEYSTTNIQVAGVDEADIIKTDGTYIYAISRNNLFIVQAYPADSSKVLAKIEFKSNPSNIYINGDSLVVFGQDYNTNDEPIFRTLPRQNAFSYLKVFDIKDRSNPKQVKDLDFEGTYYNSRMVGDYVYFLTQSWNYDYDEIMPLPIILENDLVINKKTSTSDLGDIYYFDMPYDSYRLLQVAAINVKNTSQDVETEVYVLDNTQNMYVSEKNIYLTYTKRLDEEIVMMELVRELVFPQLSDKEREKISAIEAIDESILSKREKMQKIGAILEKFGKRFSKEEEESWEKKMEEAAKKRYKDLQKELEKTVIHKIAISDGSLKYQTMGEVIGSVLNQFSMDENDGYFRIATTKGREWSRFDDDKDQKSYSNLYILDEDLQVTGKVEGLAEDERIYSVRFMQGRAYLVTFKQTDPLFVIDVSNPNDPKVLGELKIPGFSSYLHPYDDKTLIGLGRDTDEAGRTKGLKLSLFDVSDVSKPKEIDSYTFGDRSSGSLALDDHKAFLFSKEKNLLAIPVNIYERSPVIEPFPMPPPPLPGISTDALRKPPMFKNEHFKGAMVFSVDKEKGIELRGKITHDKKPTAEKKSRNNYYYGDQMIRRSLYIKDVLYTFSDFFLKMNDLTDLDELKMLELKKEQGEEDEEDFRVIN